MIRDTVVKDLDYQAWPLPRLPLFTTPAPWFFWLLLHISSFNSRSTSLLPGPDRELPRLSRRRNCPSLLDTGEKKPFLLRPLSFSNNAEE
jgi:hypothetical protein